MEKTHLSFAFVAATIAMTLLQACVGTGATGNTSGSQCAKPTLIQSDATSATKYVRVRIRTNTAGAYLRYTLDDSTPTSGPSGHGTEIAATSGEIEFTVGVRPKILKAIAYKPELADSPIAEGTYVYQSPY